MRPFRNEPLTDFHNERNSERMRRTLELVEKQLGREYPLRIGAEKIVTDEKLKSYNPWKKGQVVGVFQKAPPELAVRAVEQANAAFHAWSRTPAEKRASYLLKIAERLRRRKMELSAWMVYEVGKSWAEADADTAEAIDFAEFYAREMLRIGGPQPLVKIPKEKNELRYIPLGVGIVIPPWNFPLAIMAGMTLASIVAGNTVVLKPSSDAPTVAAKFFELLDEVRLPAAVANFVTGSGAAIGDELVSHPKTRYVAFTGSKEVGLRINELASRVAPGQIWIKRVIAEMGGKDSIIVDSDTNLDEAAAGVVTSAFGYQGQKCSACSRAIVVDKVYEEFTNKLVAKSRELRMGATADPTVNFGPVINERAMESVRRYIETGKREGRLLLGGRVHAEQGYFVEPTVIADVDPKARLSQEEIFGPVLSVIRARDYDEALDIANNTEYGLTGAVYTNSKKKIAKAKERFHVGNLYVNRKCTGALVGAHPFGGFNMSGTDSKAGGRDYLLLFTQAKVMSERQ